MRLLMKNISKGFPGVQALSKVDLELKKGEILGLLGENGAGKSTLIKILSGAYYADSGKIFIDYELQNFKTPHDAQLAGVSIIYQELNYYDELSVGENIFVGRLPKTKMRFVDWKKLNRLAKEQLTKLGLNIDPKKKMSQLTTAEKQLVEIAKAISREMKILVMDEPTAALNDEEVTRLIKNIKQLATEGISIVYISHRLEEIFLVSNRVEVLRDGRRVGVFETQLTNKAELVKAMVGREISEMYPKRSISLGDTLIDIQGIGNDHIKDITFSTRRGEILGVFGLMGSGRTKLCEALFGIDKIVSGTVTVNGKELTIHSPRDAKRAGIAYVPSERKSEGLILKQSVRENFSTAIIHKIKKLMFIMRNTEQENAKKWVRELSISTPTIETFVELLSGGNQQKVVLGKWLETKPQVIILNEPTRGIDVGAKVEIYSIIEDLCDEGLAVILVSSEQPEILALSDRIVVLCEGKMTGILQKDEYSPERLMQYAIGG